MTAIVSRPYTPEGEETWIRVYGKKKKTITFQAICQMDETDLRCCLVENGFDPGKPIYREENFVDLSVTFIQ